MYGAQTRTKVQKFVLCAVGPKGTEGRGLRISWDFCQICGSFPWSPPVTGSRESREVVVEERVVDLILRDMATTL